MRADLRGRDLITTQDWSLDELESLFELASELKRQQGAGEPHALLRDRVLAMLFFFSSTRTRISFEAGMAQLGGHAQFIESQTTQISHGDTAREIGQIVGRYCDAIAIRQCDWGIGNGYIRDVAAASPAPVLNMQCDVYHPFQILADLLTIRERFGNDLRGRTMNISWAYASSYQKPISVPQSLLLLMSRYGMHLRLTHPPEYRLMPQIIGQARANTQESGGSLEILDDFAAGFEGADIIYPKSWGALLTTGDDRESAHIGRQYTDWIADGRRMSLAQPHAVYMHCLPADRNIEVTDAVLDGPQSIVYDEAENRLHVQKAALALTVRPGAAD